MPILKQTKIEKSADLPKPDLRKQNLVMSGFHFVQGLIVLLFSNDFSVPITTNYLRFDPVLNQALPNYHIAADIKIAPLIALFFFLSAMAHLFVSAPKIYDWYIANLAQNINYARWYEYMFSSSLMIVLIGFLCGIYDLSTIILMFALNATMIMFGLMMELHNQTTKKINWTAYVLGCVAGALPWLVLAMYFYSAVSSNGDAVPTFVYFILPTLFVLFNCFAVNMFLQYKKIGPWRDYIFGERVYIVLSLVAKSALAWQIFFGALR